MNIIYNLARQFVDKGIGIIPLYHRSKIPALPSWERYQTILSNNCELSQWFATDWNNYGVVAGWHNLMFLDFDDMTAFAMWLDYFLMLNKHETIYPMPYIVRSARGAHVYLSAPGSGSNEKRLGVDVKFHGYVVGAGSTHPSGTQYVAMTDFRLTEVYSLRTILPDELFPLVVAKPAECAPAFDFQPNHTEYNYDPFAAASMVNDTDLITKVKQSVRIESLFADAKRTSIDGRWLAAICPFHDDHNPSLWIDTHRQLCGCNVCGMRPMDAINLYARQHNISESIAVKELAKEVGIWK